MAEIPSARPGVRGLYIWREGATDETATHVAPNNWESFFVCSAWEYDEERSEYFIHLYDRLTRTLNGERFGPDGHFDTMSGALRSASTAS